MIESQYNESEIRTAYIPNTNQTRYRSDTIIDSSLNNNNKFADAVCESSLWLEEVKVRMWTLPHTTSHEPTEEEMCVATSWRLGVEENTWNG